MAALLRAVIILRIRAFVLTYFVSNIPPCNRCKRPFSCQLAHGGSQLPESLASTHSIGSLVQVRGRDWVVVPSDDPDQIIRLRPLSGSEDESIGIHRLLEGIDLHPAIFPDPDPNRAGDYVGGKLLRNAARLSLRSGAGPFRSLGRISVRPRPYQFVPLIMALRLDRVRILIADDVGVGKTIEAGLIARELLDRGDAFRLCVLCPPHLCDQWQVELEQKFHIHAAVVRTSTIARLERNIPRGGKSLYQYYKHLIVSIDFAKGDRRRHDFLAGCPDLVIVDEVHAAADPGVATAREQQQRHELLREIAKDAGRHLLLLTATPHSGIEDSFRSLLGLLKHQFARLNLQALSESDRKTLAQHLVQRRRGDVAKWMGTDTPFPKRVPPYEKTYKLTAEYGKLFQDVLEFTRQTVQVPGLQENRRRVRYWAALTLLRCLMSSPAAAVKAFAAREDTAPDESNADAGAAETDELRAREILDPLAEATTLDSVPETAVELGSADLTQTDRTKLRALRQRAQAIADSGNDPKLDEAYRIILDMLQRGFRPIVWCRFIATADYVATQLEEKLKSNYATIRVKAVTSGTGDDEEREATIASLVESEKRVLVATDCLSEGINLQEHFDAVLHYDLPWNPNRLEQREGRVDRFGQKRTEVCAVVLYSPDNPIDGIVLNVLLRKARQIYDALGIRVSVPIESESVVQAIVKAVFENWRGDPEQLPLGFAGVESVKVLHLAMEREAKREEETRTRFAQHAIRPDEVQRELEATDSVLGDPQAVRRFVLDAAQRLQIPITDREKFFSLEPGKLPEELRQRLNWQKPVKLVFDSPPPKEVEGAVVVGRNHPFVTYLSDRILGMAFRPRAAEENFRCGVAYTNAVKVRTVLVLLRVRYLLSRRAQADQFAEEVLTVGYKAQGTEPGWLPINDPNTLALLENEAAGNIAPAEKQERLRRALEEVLAHRSKLTSFADSRARELEEAHDRLKQQIGGARVKATAYPPDILGFHVLLPGGQA